jgi:hypothetical protein
VGEGKYRNRPSVRTERSWRMNQIPLLFSGSVRRNALADRLPIRFLVNMVGDIPGGGIDA